jgi:hypothetical protein
MFPEHTPHKEQFFAFGGKVHSFELLATCNCSVVVPYRQMSAGFPNLKSSINLSKPYLLPFLINLASFSKSLIALLILFFQENFDGKFPVNI